LRSYAPPHKPSHPPPFSFILVTAEGKLIQLAGTPPPFPWCNPRFDNTAWTPFPLPFFPPCLLSRRRLKFARMILARSQPTVPPPESSSSTASPPISLPPSPHISAIGCGGRYRPVPLLFFFLIIHEKHTIFRLFLFLPLTECESKRN